MTLWLTWFCQRFYLQTVGFWKTVGKPTSAINCLAPPAKEQPSGPCQSIIYQTNNIQSIIGKVIKLNHVISVFTSSLTRQATLNKTFSSGATNTHLQTSLLNHSLTHIHYDLKDERSGSYRSHLIPVPGTSAQGRLRVQAVRGPGTKLHWSAIDLWGCGVNYRGNLPEV